MALRIEEGSFVAVLGQGGSGKSTLARILNTTLAPDSGSVLICGVECKDRSSSLAARANVGLVLQNPDSQIVGDTVEDDVAFALENMGLERDEMLRRIEEALSLTGLSNLRFCSPRELSGGQKQLLAIAGCLAMQCKCIVLDEALSMLDPSSRGSILKTLRNLNREKGFAVVLMTHRLEDISDADTVHVLQGGTVVESGDPESVSSSQVCRDLFGGDFLYRLPLELRKREVALPDDVVTADDVLRYLTRKGVAHA